MKTKTLEIDIRDWICNVKTMLSNNQSQQQLAIRIIDQVPILVIESLLPLPEDMVWRRNQNLFPDILPDSYESVAFTTLWTLLKNYLHIELATFDRNVVRIQPFSINNGFLYCWIADVTMAFIQKTTLDYKG